MESGRALLFNTDVGERTPTSTSRGEFIPKSGEWLTSLPRILPVGSVAGPDQWEQLVFKIEKGGIITVADRGQPNLPLMVYEPDSSRNYELTYDVRGLDASGPPSAITLGEGASGVTTPYTERISGWNALHSKLSGFETPRKWSVGTFDVPGGAVLERNGVLRITDQDAKILKVLNSEPYDSERGGMDETPVLAAHGHSVTVADPRDSDTLIAATPVGPEGRISVYGSEHVADMKNKEGASYKFSEIFNEATYTYFTLTFSPRQKYLKLFASDRNDRYSMAWETATGKLLHYGKSDGQDSYSAFDIPIPKGTIDGVYWTEDESMAFVIWTDSTVEAFKGDFSKRLGALNLPAAAVEYLQNNDPSTVSRSPDGQYIALGHIIIHARTGEAVIVMPEGSVVSSDWSLVVRPVQEGAYMEVLDLNWWTAETHPATRFSLADRILAHQMKSVFLPGDFRGEEEAAAPVNLMDP